MSDFGSVPTSDASDFWDSQCKCGDNSDMIYAHNMIPSLATLSLERIRSQPVSSESILSISEQLWTDFEWLSTDQLDSKSVTPQLSSNYSALLDDIEISCSDDNDFKLVHSRWYDLNEAIMVRISEFMPRLEHFTTMCQISVDCNRLFSVHRYFNAAQPLLIDLFRRDTHYFDSVIKPAFFKNCVNGKDNSSLAVDNGSTPIVVSLFSDRYSRGHIYEMLKFYLLFYDKFLSLQSRYNRSIASKYNKLPHSKVSRRHSRCQTRLLIESGAVGNDNAMVYSFPKSVKTVCISDDIDSIKKRDVYWLGRILENVSCQTPFIEWDLSHCNLSNRALDYLSDCVHTRPHLLPISQLNLSHNRTLTDDSIESLLICLGENCPKVTRVNLTYTSISDHSCALTASYFATYVDLNNVTTDINGAMPLLNVMWSDTFVTQKGEQLFAQIISTVKNH